MNRCEERVTNIQQLSFALTISLLNSSAKTDCGKQTIMSDDILRYTDLAATIQLAKSAGMTTREITREMTRGMTYSDALRFAKRAAPLLDIRLSEFMRLRKNE